ncbi:MAG: hypothetical protein ABL907_14645 [Hyphomicrobium sp.]
MSKKQIQATEMKEEENYDAFAETLKKIIATPPDNRGPAAKAVMSAFQVYYAMIGGVAARSEKLTR